MTEEPSRAGGSGGPPAGGLRPSHPGRAGRTVGLSESLAQLSRRIGTAPPDTLAQVFARWAETVGETIAAHARPERIDGHALVVTVDSPAWASHLRTLATELLSKLSEAAGEGAPTTLVIRVRAIGRGSGAQP
jgi:predicted nucleic acid-binding Zn ribbon protein